MKPSAKSVYDYLCGQPTELRDWSIGAACYRRMTEFLEDLFPNRADLSILEIGTCRGMTACLLAQYGTVLTLDVKTYDHMQEIIDGSPCSSASRIVRLVGADCRTARKLLNPSNVRFDVAFIDGCHTYEAVSADIVFCRQFTDTIMFHDYHAEKFPGTLRAIDEARVDAVEFRHEPDCSLCVARWKKRVS